MKTNALYGILLMGLLTACSSETTPEKEVVTSSKAKEPVKPETDSEETLSITGRVDVSPNARVSIHAPINSYIQDLPVRIGDKISKGQVIAYLEHPDILKLQEDYLTSKSDFEVENENYKRKQELFSSKSISRKEFLEAEKVYSSTKARLERLSAELRFTGISPETVERGILSRIPIKSPINGMLVAIKSNKGKYMAATDEIMTIIDTRDKWIVFQVFPNQLSSIQLGDTITYHTTGNRHKAIVRSISAAMSEVSRGVEVICIPLTQQDLNVGQVVFGSISPSNETVE
jgi:membrane fusion protein, heavy metal efflux system